jgi:hypothetical protein
MVLSPLLPPLLAGTGSPEIQASQHAGALSSGEAEGKSEGNSTHEDEGEGENDAYGEGDDRCGDSVLHFREQFDPENPLEIDWSGFKYPVPKHFVPRFRQAHAIAAMFHLNDELAAKFPVLNSQINEGLQAHYKRRSYQRYSATTKHRCEQL